MNATAQDAEPKIKNEFKLTAVKTNNLLIEAPDIQKVISLNACRLVKERNPGGGVQEGEVGMKEPVTDNYSQGQCQFH